MLSDASVGESLVAERYNPSATVLSPKIDHPNSGKTGAQLAEEIEKAHHRMLAARKAEESAKEFLVGKNTKVNAGIPRKTLESVPVPQAKKVLSAAEKYPLVDNIPAAIPVAPREVIDSSSQLADLQAEIADMRYLLEQQLDRLSGEKAQPSDSPVLAIISRRLERLGLPKDVVSTVISQCNKTNALADAWREALAKLSQQVPVNGSDIVDKGGIFAFVGPTGVGKTTTIGKLAARYVLKHGADKVALITTDTYRIAAHDQLRSLARILRVPVRVVDEANSLDMVLRSLRHCSLVLIDTAGFRHGDPHLKAQLKALADIKSVKTYLVMSCNSQEQMLKASIHAYGGARLQGSILTKLDETASMGEALGVVMQNRLPIVYTTDGQDIPKNIDVARAQQLVSKAVGLLKSKAAPVASRV
jgi:flagellar biosynthesis protein FlhF